MPIRVVTLNLWGRGDAWEERRPVLADGLRKLGADLVAFQEEVHTGNEDQTADLLGPGYHVVHSARREADGRGCSIASRWPPAAIREVDLDLTPRTADFACTALVVEIAAPEPVGPLLFVNHLPSFELDYEHEREQQTVVVARLLEELAGRRRRHVVVAGDLDATPDAASVRFWHGRQSLGGMSVCYQDAWERWHPGDPGHTRDPLVTSRGSPPVIDGERPLEIGRRIDHLLVRCGHHGPTLDVVACERIFDEPVDGVWASDHFGVMADLEVPS